jgi:tetratricopeptide (TPR) repeat protein
MYNSYKSKKKNRKYLKYISALAIILIIFYFGNKYKQYIFFWKYTSSKLSRELDNIIAKPKSERSGKLLDISGVFLDYCLKNQDSAESFLLMGKIYYLLANDKLNKTFTELIIYNKTDNIPEMIKPGFIDAVKYLRKGIALSHSGKTDPEYNILLAKSYYYSGYYDPGFIFSTINNPDPAQINDAEDIRFISIAGIINGNKEYGIEILEKFGKLSDNIKDKFFKAKAYNLAGKYTDAIIKFKEIIEITTDNELKKLGNVNLGVIYFNQSLYKESLVHFINAYILDGNDNNLKIWIGKNYSAMGDRKKAKQIWNEVLASDQSNNEVKKLLGVL